MSTARLRNSSAASWIAGSDSVTRTTPSWPTRSASSSARSARRFEFPRACGLTMTPMPDTSGRRTRHRELTARGLDVLPAALADGRVQVVVVEYRLETEDPGAWARREGRSREGVERDQVHLGAEPVQEPDEPAGVVVRVVLVLEEDVFERDTLPARQGYRLAGREQGRERVAAVHRHQAAPLRVGGGMQRDGEVHTRLGDEAGDHGREADRRDRDPARRDGVAPLGAQDLERRPDRVVVRERLPHAHEDDVGERPWPGEHLPGGDLADDLGRREVP